MYVKFVLYGKDDTYIRNFSRSITYENPHIFIENRKTANPHIFIEQREYTKITYELLTGIMFYTILVTGIFGKLLIFSSSQNLTT